MARRRYFDRAVLPLVLLALLLGAAAFASLGMALVGWGSLTNGTTTARLGAVFTTWFIPVEFNSVFLNPGDRVPFMVEQASQGIVRTADHAFVLPITGVYSCMAQAFSRSDAYFFDLVLNPDIAGGVILPGSEFNSNAQFNEPGLSTVSLLFNATAGDSLVMLYNNSKPSAGQQMKMGAQAFSVLNAYHERPCAFIHIRRIA